MPNSLGVSQYLDRHITDWEHVVQSITKILKTPIGSRVMRRDFGSEIPDLIDRAMTAANILKVYIATAVAIAKWEPRFRVSGVNLNQAGPDGGVELIIYGRHLPRGHVGDFTPANDNVQRLVVAFG